MKTGPAGPSATLLAPLREALGAGDATEVRGWWVPGRIEFLGKHTDYAGGRSLVCATEQGFAFLARPRADRTLHVVVAATGERAELPLEPTIPIPSGVWAAYPATVARRLARDFGPLTHGLDLALSSDLPRAAGLSSSSALVVGVALAVAGLNRLEELASWRAAFPDREALAGYLGAVENGKAFRGFPTDFGVGTMGGTQDHTAILCARPGMLSQYGFAPVRFERTVPFPPDYVLAVGVSGVVAAKNLGALHLYNARAEAVESLLGLWQSRTTRNDATLFAALASEPGARARLEGWLRGHAEEAVLRARLEQFAAECEEIIPAVGNAFERADLAALGPLIDRSQLGAERGLGNQVAETIQLQRSARRLGAAAASAFGAGFGGSVWAMVRQDDAERFLSDWSAGYLRDFPDHAAGAEFFTTRPGRRAEELAAPALRG